MQYRQMGRTGLRVSTICLGAMTFGEAPGFMAGVGCDEATSRAILDRAFEAGVNFIDTADVYGAGVSEEIVGRWMKPRRDHIVLATKARFPMGSGPNDVGLGRLHLKQAVEASLRRLGTDHIDLYQVHMQDARTPIEETLDALDRLVQEGKILYAGCSNYTGYRLVESLWAADRRNVSRYDCLQAQYSLIVRDPEKELLPACRAFGVGFIAWSPLASGLLSGKYRRDQPPPAGSRLAAWSDTMKRLDRENKWKVVEALLSAATDLGTSPATLALAWALAKPGMTSVIIGARSVEQLADNLAADALVVPAEILARLDAASAPEEWGYPYDFITRVDGRW
jgi:aryl-alcohol dehydrogenase-like predicted oxidoreductase